MGVTKRRQEFMKQRIDIKDERKAIRQDEVISNELHLTAITR